MLPQCVSGKNPFRIHFPVPRVSTRQYAKRTRLDLGKIPPLELTSPNQPKPIPINKVTVSSLQQPTIDWKVLPPCREIQWHELSTEARQKFARVLALLACPTIFPISLFIVESPNYGLYCAVGTAITGIGSLIFKQMGPHPLDAKHRREQRAVLEKKINTVTFDELKIAIHKEYTFTENELQILMSKDKE